MQAIETMLWKVGYSSFILMILKEMIQFISRNKFHLLRLKNTGTSVVDIVESLSPEQRPDSVAVGEVHHVENLIR